MVKKLQSACLQRQPFAVRRHAVNVTTEMHSTTFNGLQGQTSWHGVAMKVSGWRQKRAPGDWEKQGAGIQHRYQETWNS